MTQEEIEALAQQISDICADLNLEPVLGALGMVVVQVMRQYPTMEERMAVTVGWITVLADQMRQDYKRHKAN